ncbi:hypothetical protein BYT27DRAFT_7076206 [Phlegmacium glaucopus]|nr:hypothetical protein BYT27DRAFT_7076206 [Phlegmacium glaucopus]
MTSSGTSTHSGIHWDGLLTTSSLLYFHVSIAMELGQPVKVPIILCFLADSMVILHENALPLSFDLSLLATLDLGAHDNSNKSQVVSTYEHIWWSGHKLRDLGTVTILDGSTLEACLNSYHLKRSQSPASAGCVHAGGTGLSSGTSLMAGISATLGQIPQGPAPFIPAQGTHSLATGVQGIGISTATCSRMSLDIVTCPC